ncbi:hypothetical protein G3N55_09655 [Dissulfurirhabdus thermomarina]|uniref:DUF2802 domain-containing protein n=1 Tax=Dissulfurirhabdus thermomarina TaxID=1765737 RepID=A0A6N9TTP1_DISTH|nr:hypothetical protein [Dissulfurirhabdus thermomarina]NDY43104.1 hypothetical protein [Dissulfurirhabdus thermomarina]NMX24454.1 hypothetical protein [Dissulfurirhabdus thermomarina]
MVPSGPLILLAGVQLLLDILLIGLILALYRRIGRREAAPAREFQRGLDRLEELRRALEANLAEKAALAQRLERLLGRTPEAGGPVSAERRREVIAAWKEGRPVAEIAAATGLTDGEVELVIALARAAEAGTPGRA